MDLMKGFVTDMFKRTITALLSVFLLAVLSVTACAAIAAYDLTYDLSSGGKNEITVKQGDIVTVDFYIKRTDNQASFDLLSYQNEIEYDKTFFELIKPDKWNFRYTPDSNYKVDDERLDGQKIVKIAEMQAHGLNYVEWIGSFQLRVIAQSGSSIVRSSYQKAKNPDNVSSNISCVNLKVNIGQPFNVIYPADVFDSTKTPKSAFNGVDYHGEISDTYYDEIYDFTVTYEIAGNVKNADVLENTFTVPGEDITGDMKLDCSKQLNIKIYVEEYAPGITLVRVEGAREGYTFAGNKMIKSANSENMGAWVVEGELTLDDAEALIGVAGDASDNIFESTDITQDGKTNLNDLAVVLGCSKGYYTSKTTDEVTRYLLSDIDGDREVTQGDYNQIVTAYKQVKE